MFWYGLALKMAVAIVIGASGLTVTLLSSAPAVF
jgi:hypothetical protein